MISFPKSNKIDAVVAMNGTK